MRRRNLLSSFTLWVLLFSAAFVALQVFPITGIVLMMLQAPLLNLVLIYLVVIAFIVDCLIGPFPRLLVLVPVVGIGVFALWYKGQYDADRAAMPTIEAELQSRNTASPIPLDPATQSLVSHSNRVMLDYRIPVVYVPNRIAPPPDKFIAFSIRPRHGCNVFSKSNPQGTDFTEFMGSGIGLICVTRSETVALPGSRVELANKTSKEVIDGHDVTLNTTTLMLDGVPRGQYTTGYTSVVPAWPLPEFGCFLIDNPPAWKCVHGLGRVRFTLDTVPGAGTPADTNPTEMLVAIDRRTPEEIAALTAK